MPKFKVRGESTCTWELVLEVPDDDPKTPDYLLAQARSLEFVADMIDLQPFGDVSQAEITGQTDRVLRCIEVS